MASVSLFLFLPPALPPLLYLPSLSYRIYSLLQTPPLFNLEGSDSRLAASLLVKNDCFVLLTLVDLAVVVSSRWGQGEFLWQREYPGLTCLYLLDAAVWMASLKLATLEFERNEATHRITRGYFLIQLVICLITLSNPWEYRVINFWLNLVKLAVQLILAIYAIYIPKDTNDVGFFDISRILKEPNTNSSSPPKSTKFSTGLKNMFQEEIYRQRCKLSLEAIPVPL